jgi:hypothetical protein
MKAQKVRLTLALALTLSSFAVPLCAQMTTPIFVEGRFEILDKVRRTKAAKLYGEILDNTKSSHQVRLYFDRLQPKS